MSEQEQPEKTQQEILEDYLKENRAKLTVIADVIADVMHNNWFTVERVMKKTAYKTPEAAQGILQLLCMSDFCVAKTEGNVTKFKISFSPAEKIAVLEYEIAQIKEQLEYRVSVLQKKKEQLEKELVA